MMAPGKTVERGEKKARILEAAVHAFSRQGYHQTRVSDIAKAANVADGTVYIGTQSRRTGYFYAVDAQTGEVKWRLEQGKAMAYSLNGVVSSPVVVDGTVYYGSLDGNLYAVRVGF